MDKITDFFVGLLLGLLSNIIVAAVNDDSPASTHTVQEPPSLDLAQDYSHE